MGLFGLLKKSNTKDLQPLEFYLDKIPYYELIRWHNILLGASFLASGNPVAVDTTGELHNFFGRDNLKIIPKAYHKQILSMEKMLLRASEQGGMDAAFYLFLFYQLGIHKYQKYQVYTPADFFQMQDAQKAAAYRVLAQERGSNLEKAYTWLEDNCHVKEGLPIYDIELLFLTMHNNSTSDEEVIKQMTGYSYNQFTEIGTYMMLYLASMGFAFCLGYVAVSLASYLSSTHSINVFGRFLHEYNTDADLLETLKLVIRNLYDRANGGDVYAAYAIRHYGLKL